MMNTLAELEPLHSRSLCVCVCVLAYLDLLCKMMLQSTLQLIQLLHCFHKLVSGDWTGRGLLVGMLSSVGNSATQTSLT